MSEKVPDDSSENDLIAEMALEHRLRERFYPESRDSGVTSIDGTLNFYARVRELVPLSGVVLDVGCGRGAAITEDPVTERREARDLRGLAGQVIGIDPDPAAQRNPAITEFRLLQSQHWPVDTSSIDVCLADYVMEHVADPIPFVSEAYRVLKHGGSLCLRTPNAHSYFGLISRLSPRRYQKKIVGVTSCGRDSADVFPTYYRLNTRAKITSVLKRHGFDPHVTGYEAEPSYLAFSRVAYRLGVLHQRFAPERWRLNLFVFARKR